MEEEPALEKQDCWAFCCLGGSDENQNDPVVCGIFAGSGDHDAAEPGMPEPSRRADRGQHPELRELIATDDHRVFAFRPSFPQLAVFL